MSGAAVAPALPAVADAFEDVPRYELLVQLILTMPALFITIGAPIAGLLCDRVGRRPVLLWGTVVYGFAGASGFVLDDLHAILAGRAVLGLAVAAVITSCSTLIGDYFEGHDRERVLSQQIAFMSFGGVALPLLSGVLALITWRHPFLVYLSAFLILPGIVRTIYEPNRDGSTLPATEHETEMIGVPIIVMIYALGVTLMVGFYLLPVQLPFYLRELVGASPGEAGVVLASVSVAGGFASLLFRRVKRLFSYPGFIALTFSMMGGGYLLIARSEGYLLIVVGILLVGLGMGWTNPNLSLWLINGTPERIRGRLVGGMAMGFFLGQFISPIVARPFIAAGGYDYGYRLAGLAMLGIGGAFLLSRLSRRIKTASPVDADEP